MADPILATHNLTKQYGKRLAVDKLNLEIPEGEIFGFLGPNGSGKTTTIRMLLSLIRPSSGEAYCFGQSTRSNYPSYLRQIGAMVEKADFYGNLSALTNLQMLARMHVNVGEERCMEVIERAGLLDRRHDPVKSYSHGMRQRLGIAQAILHRPKLLILDEPSTGLDPQGMHEMRQMILAFVRDEGMTVFLSSHLLNEVEQICTSMAVLSEGKLLVSGPVKKFLSEETSTLTELQAEPLSRAREIVTDLPFVSDLHDSSGGIRFRVNHEQRPAVIQALADAHVKVYTMNAVSNLEDYFLSLFGSKELSI